MVTSSRSMVNGPASITDHGQAGVTPSSCVCNAAWRSGLAVCWPRRPPIVRVCAAWWHANAWSPTCVCGFHRNTRHPTPTLGSRGHIENAPAGITPPPPSMQLALTELAHPSPPDATQPHCHAASPHTLGRRTACARCKNKRSQVTSCPPHTYHRVCAPLCLCVCLNDSTNRVGAAVIRPACWVMLNSAIV